jgi:hypothetical protein
MVAIRTTSSKSKNKIFTPLTTFFVVYNSYNKDAVLLKRRINFCGLSIAEKILCFIRTLRIYNASSAGILITSEALNVIHIHAASIEKETRLA